MERWPNVIALVIFSLCLGVTGAAATAWLWSRDEEDAGKTGALEVLASWAVVTIALVVAIDWTLSAVHALRVPFLLATSIALAAGSVVYLRARTATRRGLRAIVTGDIGADRTTVLLVAAPLLTWIAFAVWRGSILPVTTHDAIAYHLPRAVDVVRTGGWRYLPVEDFRLAWFPADYELLLADVLAFTDSDRATSLVSIALYVAAIVFAAAWGERRGGPGARPWISALAWASTPLALLHCGHAKNDVLMMICTLAAAFWGARWVVRGGRAPLVLLLVGAALGVGTKAIGATALVAAAVGFTPFGLVRRLRATFGSIRSVVVLALGSVALLLLLGIVPFLAHLAHPYVATDIGMTPAEMTATSVTPRYDGFANFWRFPILVWLRAFTSDPHSVVVPWLGERWFWPKYEIYFSDFGVAVSALALLIPVGAALALRAPPPEPGSEDATRIRERRAATIFLLVTIVAVLPVQYRVDGFFNSYMRYVFFVPLLVVDALDPIALRLRSAGARDLAAKLLLAAFSAFFFVEGWVVAKNDTFAPWDYVRYLVDHPALHEVPVWSFPRAAQVVDHAAGPDDRIAIDAGFGAWVYPAYGEKLTRTVDILPLQAAARAPLLDRADWVIVDRFWAICWGSPELTDMGRADQFLEKGRPTKSDLAFYETMMRDARFGVVYRDGDHGQVVFHQLPAVKSAPNN